MKIMRWMTTATAAMGLIANFAQAQAQFVFVEKTVNYTQNSESAPSVASGTPYEFDFEVNGSGMSTFASSHAVEITSTASGSGTAGPITASYSSGSGEERWSISTFSYGNKASMDAAFANGVYNLNVNNTSFNVTLGGGSGPYTDGYPVAAPMVTGLSAGDFNGSGQLKIDLSLTNYTFNLNGLTGYTSGGHVGIFLQGVQVAGNPVEAESIYFAGAGLTDPEVTSLSFNPSASTMVAGNTYIMEIEYNLAPYATTGALGGSDLDLGLFTYRTELTLVAIPEPSTYAAVIGVLALAGVLIHRRRRIA